MHQGCQGCALVLVKIHWVAESLDQRWPWVATSGHGSKHFVVEDFLKTPIKTRPKPIHRRPQHPWANLTDPAMGGGISNTCLGALLPIFQLVEAKVERKTMVGASRAAL